MSRCANWCPCLRSWLLLLAGVLIIVGVRFALIERFTSTVPLADDWLSMDKLEQWSRGARDWGWLVERNNGTHLVAFTRLLDAMSVELNGLWEPRVDAVLHALVYAGYAVIAALFFSRIVPERRALLRGLVLFIFAVPFAGVRTTWALLSCFDFAGLFAFLAFGVQAWHSRKSWALPVALLLALAASLSLGSGCMAGLAMAGVALLEMIMARKATRSGLLWTIAGTGIFLGFYLTMGKPVSSDPRPFVLGESISAVCKSLGWPIFLSPLAVMALVPFGLLLWQYFRSGVDFHTDPRVRALLLAWSWLILQAVAIGFMRGENGNRGIPSLRYNDLLMPFVFVEAATLLFLHLRQPVRSLLIVRNAWALLLTGGLCLQFLWRTWPFMAHENGEYSEWVRQRNVRDFFRGNPEPLRTAQREVHDTGTIFMVGDRLEPMLTEIAAGKWNIKTAGSFAGIPLTFPAGSGVIPGGVPPEYFTQPPLEYYGTFTPKGLEGAIGSAISEPFMVHGNSLTFDLIVDKKGRFGGYSFDGLKLQLVPEIVGSPSVPTDLLLALWTRVPSLLRDRETVCIPIQPGLHRLEVEDNSPDLSLAFSAPLEGGRASSVVHQLLQSSKLLIAAGVALLAGLKLTKSPAA